NRFATRVKSRWESPSTWNTARPAASECRFTRRRNWNPLTGASISCASVPTTARRKSGAARWDAPWCTSPVFLNACAKRRTAANAAGDLVRSPVDQLHHVFRVAQSRSRAGGKDFIQPTQIVWSQFQIHRRGVFLKILAPLGSGDRGNVVALRQHPCERQL